MLELKRFLRKKGIDITQQQELGKSVSFEQLDRTEEEKRGTPPDLAKSHSYSAISKAEDDLSVRDDLEASMNQSSRRERTSNASPSPQKRGTIPR